jgi:hypothetical protein
MSWLTFSALGGYPVEIRPNGGGAPILTLDAEETLLTQRPLLHQHFTNVSRIALWTAAGAEVLWSYGWTYAGDDGQSGGSVPRTSEPLYVVLDDFPFVWPLREVGSSTSVAMPGAESVSLTLMSESPRVLVADGMVSSSEAAAIMRLAAPNLTASITYVGGAQGADSNRARTSSNAWLTLPAEQRDGETADADTEALRAVWHRISALARQSPLAAENMQALRYDPGQLYQYHIDTGGSRAIAMRYISVLIYLNEAFEGGETNFATSGRAEVA